MEQENIKILKELKENVEVILTCLKGNDIRKDGGIVGDIKFLENEVDGIKAEVDGLKKFNDRLVWTILGLISIGSVLSWIISQALSYLKK